MPKMGLTRACVALACFLPLSLAAQVPALGLSRIISMNEEPHHHLVLHNDTINVFRVEVAPGDSIVMHRHNDDTIAIAIGDQEVTIGVPGKPDVHQKNADGQIRLQRTGYVHSTRADGPIPYRTIAVELLHPQSNPRNLCASVIAGLPQSCPAVSDVGNLGDAGQPEFESDQTRIRLVRVPAGKSAEVGHLSSFHLIVALDPVLISPASGEGPEQGLQPGDFIWFEKEGQPRSLKTNRNQKARFVEISFNP